MTNVAELLIESELKEFRDVAQAKGWEMAKLSPTSFQVSIHASDDECYHLFVECEHYPAEPPAWHWYDIQTGEKDLDRLRPIPQDYFHPSGMICAPWNRLAYKQINSAGPHSDWTIGAWKENPKTGACKTLAYMALRIATELNSTKYKGRKV